LSAAPFKNFWRQGASRRGRERDLKVLQLAVVGAVVGEFVGSRSVLGYYMLLATGNFDTPFVFACVIFLTVMGDNSVLRG
jgi:NitT/TauT family transport system permease protein